MIEKKIKRKRKYSEVKKIKSQIDVMAPILAVANHQRTVGKNHINFAYSVKDENIVVNNYVKQAIYDVLTDDIKHKPMFNPPEVSKYLGLGIYKKVPVPYPEVRNHPKLGDGFVALGNVVSKGVSNVGGFAAPYYHKYKKKVVDATIEYATEFVTDTVSDYLGGGRLAQHAGNHIGDSLTQLRESFST